MSRQWVKVFLQKEIFSSIPSWVWIVQGGTVKYLLCYQVVITLMRDGLFQKDHFDNQLDFCEVFFHLLCLVVGFGMGMCLLGKFQGFCVCVGVLVCLLRDVFLKFSLILEGNPKKHLCVAFCHLIPPAVQEATRRRAGH